MIYFMKIYSFYQKIPSFTAVLYLIYTSGRQAADTAVNVMFYLKQWVIFEMLVGSNTK